MKVVRHEGMIGLYRGLLPQLVGVAPEKAIKLSVNDLLRLFGKEDNDGNQQLALPLEIIAGGSAGASQVMFTNPLEIVKIRLQTIGEQVLSRGGDAERGRHHRQGAWVPWSLQGCLRVPAPGRAVQRNLLPAYASAKEWCQGTRKRRPHSTCSSPVPWPARQRRVYHACRRYQDEDGGGRQRGQKAYDTIPEAAVDIMKNEGPTAFFKGAAARVFRSSPQFAVTLMCYELLHNLVHPEAEPRPPTNAPINRKTTRTHFRSTAWGSKPHASSADRLRHFSTFAGTLRLCKS